MGYLWMMLVFPTPASPITRNLITGELSAVAAIDTFDDAVFLLVAMFLQLEIERYVHTHGPKALDRDSSSFRVPSCIYPPGVENYTTYRTNSSCETQAATT